MILQRIHHIIQIAIIQTIEIDMILITDLETTLKMDQITTITTINPLITPGIDRTITQTD